LGAVTEVGWRSILNEMILGANHYSILKSRLASTCTNGLTLAGNFPWCSIAMFMGNG
jgi:hypothetical protein